jgi:hypothetical protein
MGGGSNAMRIELFDEAPSLLADALRFNGSFWRCATRIASACACVGGKIHGSERPSAAGAACPLAKDWDV